MLAAIYPNPWRFQPNYEVYVLVVSLVGAYIYMVRVIGPYAVAPGQPVVTRRQLGSFVAAMVVLFVASTWPIHQIGEDYLYSVHMVQHSMMSYLLPPLVLFATPEWLARTLLGKGRAYKVFAFFARPVVAAVIYNCVVMFLHIPGVVNTATRIGWMHFSLHLVLVLTAVMMWTPVCGPLEELQMSYGGKMIYLFLMGVVPTVPAGWFAFAEKAVYSHYGDQPVRVWGMSPTEDQQLAGLIMKVVAGFYIWGIIIVMYFRKFTAGFQEENSYRRGVAMPNQEITGNSDVPLTYGAVTDAFERTDAPSEPAADRRP